MASSPVGPSTPQSSNWAPKARTRAQTTASDVAQANHDASDQIARSQQAVQDAQNDANVQLEHIRDGFDQEEMNQSQKNQEALEKQRLKGYKELRDLKLRQQAEYSRVRREGESNLKHTNDYYRNTLYQTSRKDEQDLRNQQTKQAREMQYVSSSGQGDLSQQKQDEARKMQDLRQTHEKQISELTKANTQEYERMKTNTELSRQQEASKFQGQYDAVVNQDRQAIDNLQNSASRQISDIRQDTSQKLAAYSSRQSDPFYKMMDMNAELHDKGDRYVLIAEIPPEEQNHISATVRGNTLVISGNRRNEEHLDLGPGRSRGTSAFQSYEESFPLAWPVDRNQLTKEFQGDRVIITVPKANQVEFHESYQPPQPERVRVERPNFPGYLPTSTTGELSENNPETSKVEGGRTLHPGRTLT